MHVYMGENEMWGCGASGEGTSLTQNTLNKYV